MAPKKPPKFVLDTSALLTMMKQAPGGSVVGAQVTQSAISAVNWSEVVEALRTDDVDVEGMRRDLEIVGLSIFPFTPEDADDAATLWDASHGLSLGDRACLTLAKRLRVPVLTADSTWKQRAVGVDVQLVR